MYQLLPGTQDSLPGGPGDPRDFLCGECYVCELRLQARNTTVQITADIQYTRHTLHTGTHAYKPHTIHIPWQAQLHTDTLTNTQTAYHAHTTSGTHSTHRLIHIPHITHIPHQAHTILHSLHTYCTHSSHIPRPSHMWPYIHTHYNIHHAHITQNMYHTSYIYQ